MWLRGWGGRDASRAGGTRLIALALIAVFALAVLPSSAGADTVKHTGGFLTLTRDDGGGRCTFVNIFQWAELPGAVSYTVSLEDTVTGGYTTTFPPYSADGVVEGFPPIGKGLHRQALDAGSGPGPCTSAGLSRWSLKKITATFCEDVAAFRGAKRQDKCKTQIVGTTTGPDGTPIPNVNISISGAGSTKTKSNGAYGSKVAKGSHTVSAPKGFCVAGAGRCSRSKSVTVKEGGTEAVHFVRREAALTVSGTITDEFGRGLSGVKTSLTGPESATDVTDARGRYKIDVAEEGTYELTATGSGRGPNEIYYILSGGVPSGGTAADVTLGEASGSNSANVDWELDRRLQFRVAAHNPAPANGVSRTVATVRALTQHGDPAPGVELNIDPPSSATPRAVICSTGADSQVLWPTLLTDGSISPAGLPSGPQSTTNGDGAVSFRIFPGTDPAPFLITGSRRNADVASFSSFAEAIEFTPTASRTPNRDQLARALFENDAGSTFFGDQSVVFERLAGAQASSASGLSGLDAAPLVTTGTERRGILFYPRGTLPPDFARFRATLPAFEGAFADTSFVLEDSLLQRITGTPALPSLREWAAGEVVLADAADRRNFLGWPIPTTTRGGLGTCLDGGVGNENLVWAAHSPVDLLLTTKDGKLGTDASGREHQDLAGSFFSSDGVDYVIAPEGAYKLTVTGTGSGAVVLEARHGGATSVAQFKAKKGERATFKVSGNSVLPNRFRFGGETVKSVGGVALKVTGLPKKLRAGKKTKLKLKVKDAFGDPVSFPTLKASGAAGPATVFGDVGGVITTTLRPKKTGAAKLMVSAPDLLSRKVRVKVAGGKKNGK